VSAIVEDFALTDANAALVVAICRRLDGLPLAIEFAAPRVEALGVEGLAVRLDESLRLLGAQRRVAVPRHRTMRAVIDWSHGLLREDEQRFFRALGIFTGSFTVEAAAINAVDAPTTDPDVIDRLADLVAKSLVVADVSGTGPRFRLLDTTRAFALEKLDTSGEREPVAHRHAGYYRQLFARAEAEAPARTISDWLADYAPEIDNLRAALDWAFSPGGEASIGVALTAASVPLWIRLSLLEECRGRARQALGALGTASTEDKREAMRLHAALGGSTPEASEMVVAFTKALDIARRLGDIDYQLCALEGLYFYYAGSGRFSAAKPFAEAFHALARRGLDRPDLMYMMGVSEHYVGDQSSARRHLEQVLARTAVSDHGRDAGRFQDVVRFGPDLRVSTLVFLARVLWLQGFSDQAMRTAEMSVEEARATGHALSLCYALALAVCPIALWVGDLTAAANYTRMLVDNARKHDLPRWSAYGSRFQRAMVLMGGDLVAGSPLWDASLDEVAQSDLSFRSFTGMSHLVEILVQVGRMAEGLAVLKGMEQYEAGCYTPELLRLKGELSLLQGTLAAVETANDLFRRALDEAHRQGALSWELRAAASLARLVRQQGSADDAAAVLQPVYNRFTEGFGTADLVMAKQLLDELSTPGRD
jgi:predicted ATPase